MGPVGYKGCWVTRTVGDGGESGLGMRGPKTLLQAEPQAGMKPFAGRARGEEPAQAGRLGPAVDGPDRGARALTGP